MHFSTGVIAISASLFSVSLAASSALSFTSFPTEIQAGKPVTLTWTGGNPGEVQSALMTPWNENTNPQYLARHY
jgi:hypothetical protein